MAPTDKIALAATLFDFPAGPGHVVPADPVPGPWKDLFEAEHVDGRVCQGLFRSCGAGRDWALRRASKIKLRLDCRGYTDAQVQVALSRHLQYTQPLIQRRIEQQGAAPPEVDVVYDEKSCSSVMAVAMIHAVAHAAPGITVLVTEFAPTAAHEIDTHFPSNAAAAFPQLTSLTVKNATGPIPPPLLMPNIRSLTLTFGWRQAAAVLGSLPPYLPQLNALDVRFVGRAYEQWPELLMHGPGINPTHTLTSLSTNTPLNDAALGFITSLLPALQTLHVSSLGVSDEQVADSEWAVREIRVAGKHWVTGTQLTRLPATAEGAILTLCGDECVIQLDITGAEGFDIRVRQRLSTWQLQVKSIDVFMSANVPAAAQPEALRNTLTQLATLPHPPPIHARGSGWHWTPALLHVLAETPPDITSVKAAIRTNEPLTDELLTAMIDTRQHIASVSVPSLKLQSDTLANTPWPCEELTCDTVDVTQMIKFPQVKTVRTKEVFMPVDLGQDAYHMDKFRALFNRTEWVTIDGSASITDINTYGALFNRTESRGVCNTSLIKLAVNGALTDELLGLLVNVRGSLIMLSVDSLSLQSDTHANTPWPCEELTCGTVDVSQVVKLPKVTQVRTKDIVIPESAVTEVAAHMRKLTSIDWLAVPTGNIETAHMQVTVHCTRDNQALQTALLNIARQLRIQYTRNSTLRLLRWPMTRATIEAWQPGRGLQHILSSERIRLDLSQCGYWPLTPEEYVSLLTQSTPEDFLVWKLPRTRKHLALRRAYEGRAAVAEEEVTIEIDEPV